MWEAIVARAIAERVDAVLLGGDVVDHDNRFYEATGPLERGIRRLAESGITTYAVAGNHDWDVFPRILKQLDTPLFHLLGKAGQWEETFLERNGERLLRIVGWSFPAMRVSQNPLVNLPRFSERDTPTVGLMHADIDVLNSCYAPLRLLELQASNFAMWVVGHIHKPQYWPATTSAAVLCPGSPQALDPGEPGPHGPWLVEFDGMKRVSCRQLTMSRVRYEEQDLDLSEIETEADFEIQIHESLIAALEKLPQGDESPDLVLLRLTLLGSTSLCGRINSLIRDLDQLERSRGDVRVRIDTCVNLTHPSIDLQQLSRGNDPAGALAGVLLALERNEQDEPLLDLVRQATRRMQEAYRAPTYSGIYEEPLPDCESARQLLLQQGRQLLEALRTQLPNQLEGSA
jgi:DNA repair exonuclease SbcCD nuclease subunit